MQFIIVFSLLRYNIPMRIAVLGAGFTGLSAALRLLQNGHQVTVWEKEEAPGGLSGGFKQPGWDWTLEKSYHHFFTNDDQSLNLAKSLGQEIIIKKPQTNVYIQGQILPFDSPLSLLTFPYLPFVDRLRTGFVTLYLKLINSHKTLEGQSALPWVKKFMGENATKLIWDPLFTGKFGEFKDNIALTWFWARVKKRTSSLAYPKGGYQTLANKLAEKIEKLGGKIYLNSEITKLNSQFLKSFDKIIVTLPTPVFTKIAPNLPKSYTKKLASIPHLHALNLILILKEPFLKNTYWLNITDTSFPFLVLAEHTNFMDPKYYGGKHILYIGNYLPEGHPYLKMSPQELSQIYKPYLQKINPSLPLSPLSSHLFLQPFAQPVVTPDYPKLLPDFKTPIKNVYLANLDMVYPWDRGTNYAIELGKKVVKEILTDYHER